MNRKIVLVELNEITWRLLDPICARGRLPAFAELIHNGVRGTPLADEAPPLLDPWISWTTVYTGRPQAEHGVRFLEQPPETVQGPRVWDIATDAGKSVGVFGSIMSWPPREDARGFWVPSTFSPNSDTFPESLRPIQDLNLSHTRAHTPLAKGDQQPGLLGRALQYRRLGLRISTAARVASFLVRTRFRPHRSWEKVSLQPLVNLDFFEPLYRQHRPDLATFHTNHVAHYQHRYWRATDPEPFKLKPSAEERRKFGPAIEYGYRIADEVLKRLLRLVDERTVLVVASGLGAQPYVDEVFLDGRPILRLKDIHDIVRICGIAGHCTPVSMMAPQWNLVVPDVGKREQAERTLRGAWYRSADVRLFAVDRIGNTLNFNLSQKALHPLDLDALCVFPDARGQTFKLGDLCAVQDATPKEGFHERQGVVILHGPGIRKGALLDDCSNLDLAPTILHLMGLPIPSHMKGRVLEEAFEGEKAVSPTFRNRASSPLG